MLQVGVVSASPSPTRQVDSPAWPCALSGCQTPSEIPFSSHPSHRSSLPSSFAPEPPQMFRPHCCEGLGLQPVTGVPSQTPRALGARKPGRPRGGVPATAELLRAKSYAQHEHPPTGNWAHRWVLLAQGPGKGVRGPSLEVLSWKEHLDRWLSE